MIKPQARTTGAWLRKESGELVLKALEEVAAFQSTLREQMQTNAVHAHNSL